jgi:pantothenate kinase-related protein Tda10
LDQRLYGQHIVKRLLVSAVSQHWSKPDPAKALVLSFHGDAGVGKSFVSRLIGDTLYKKGEKSEYIHNFIGIRHFYWISENDKPRMKVSP